MHMLLNYALALYAFRAPLTPANKHCVALPRGTGRKGIAEVLRSGGSHWTGASSSELSPATRLGRSCLPGSPAILSGMVCLRILPIHIVCQGASALEVESV